MENHSSHADQKGQRLLSPSICNCTRRFPKEDKETKGRMLKLLADYTEDKLLQSLVVDIMHLPESQ